MLAVTWIHWAWGLALFATIPLFVFTAWWALFGDRPRGRRRCPRCWYDLSHSSGMTCPECGFTARAEKDLHKRRSRPAIAVLAIIGCTAVSLFVIERGSTRGWLSYVPTRPLIWSLPFASDGSRGVIVELDRRMRDGELSEGQILSILERAAAGDDDAEPPGQAWQDKYGVILESWGGAMLDAPGETMRRKVESILLAVPLHIELSTRAVWPEGAEPIVDVFAEDWWPHEFDVRVTALPEIEGAQPERYVRFGPPIQPRSWSLPLPSLEPGQHSVDVSFTYEHRREGKEPWTKAGEGIANVAFKVQEAPLLEAVDSEEHRSVLETVFGRGLVKWGRGSLPVRVSVDHRPTLTELFADTAIGARVEVLRNGEPARQLDIWWEGGQSGPRRFYAWEVPMLDDALLAKPNREEDRWVLRVRGLRELALRVDGVRRYWSGEFEIPVPVRERRGNAPPRGWIPEELTPR